MATHVQHHYVPEFLLKQWHSGADKKLTQFQWMRGSLLAERYTAKAVAKGEHLYSQRKRQSSPDVGLEREFFGPRIDEPAAAVHRQLLADELDSLNGQQRLEWSRFLISLLVRTPTMVGLLSQAGRQEMARLMDEQPDGMLHRRSGDPRASLRAWSEANRPHLLEDVGLRTLPSILYSGELNHAVMAGNWSVVKLNDSHIDAVSADNPVVVLGNLLQGFAYILPISPRLAFIVTRGESYRAQTDEMQHSGLAEAINRHLVQRASRYVYSTGTQHAALVTQHLRKVE